ncbi:MAG: hypothetical protein IT373_24655 [Polyangiaceae bacterium]|nr:hypothetical protein [Polyangiaceae bacterium]
MESPHTLRRAVVVVGVLALLALRACDDDGAFVEAPPEPDDLGAVCSYHADCAHYCALGIQGAAPACTRNCSTAAPCPAGYACVARDQMGPVCLIGACTTDADCPATYACDTVGGVCLHDDIPCGADTDCPAATACNQGVCVTVCESNDDCKAGFLCQFHSRCVECMRASDCADGYACNGGQCNTACVQAQDCRAGFACLGAACSEIHGGGAGVVGTPCTADEECAGFCYGQQYCNQTCTMEDPASCPAGFACHDGHLVCTPA